MAFLEGFLLGIGTVIFIGPVLFTLLQITLAHGTKAGMSVATGIIVSDVVIVGLFYWGAIDFFKNDAVQYWLAVAGCLILLGMGAKYLVRPYSPAATKSSPSLAKTTGSFVKGFLVNFVNPFVFFVWISIVALANSKFEAELDVRIFLGAALLGIFATDTLKVLLASKLQNMLKPSFLRKAFVVIGLVLIGFGLRLAYFALNQ